MHLFGQVPGVDWTTTLEHFGLPVVVLVFVAWGITWIFKRLFGKDGWLVSATDRCIGPTGIVTGYVTATQELVGSLKTHVQESDGRMTKIVDVQDKMCALSTKLDGNQERLCGTVEGLVGECHGTHSKIIGGLASQTAAIEKKIDAMHEHFEESREHHGEQANLMEAAGLACDILDAALPDNRPQITAVRRRLEGK